MPYIAKSAGHSLGGHWRHRPGRPRARWTDQLRHDTGSVPANLWSDRQAILRDHGGAMRRPELATPWRRRWWCYLTRLIMAASSRLSQGPRWSGQDAVESRSRQRAPGNCQRTRVAGGRTENDPEYWERRHAATNHWWRPTHTHSPTHRQTDI